LVNGTTNVTAGEYEAGDPLPGRLSAAYPGGDQAEISAEKGTMELVFMTWITDRNGTSMRLSTPVCLVADPVERVSPATSTSTDAAGPTRMAAVGAVAVGALAFAIKVL
jgi:hypothetical protein